MTPGAFGAVMEGARRRMDREHDSRAWLAWHTAFLPYAEADKRPRYADLLSRPGKAAAAPARPRWEDEFAAAVAWVEAAQGR